MHKLMNYVGMVLLVVSLAACDNSETTTSAKGTGSHNQSTASDQPVQLLDGKLSFSLPVDMADQTSKLGTQANNMHVYSDKTSQKAVIVIVGDKTDEALNTLADRLEQQQRNRDPQLQVVTNKSINLKGQTLQQLDSVISANGQSTYSSVLLDKMDGKLLTVQISLPADNQQEAQRAAENIISTLTVK